MKSEGSDCVLLIASASQPLRKRWKESLRGSFSICEASTIVSLLQSTTRVRPTILLLDLTIERFQPAKQIPLLLRESPCTKIIAFVQSQADREATCLLRAGVKGYANINLDMVLLRKAIHMVQKGEIWIERRLVSSILDELLHPKKRGKTFDDHIALQRLSGRERQIALGVARGASNKEVAAQLLITETTVKAHLTSIFAKLGISDRLSLALLLANNQYPLDH